jgi:hypothetical protein
MAFNRRTNAFRSGTATLRAELLVRDPQPSGLREPLRGHFGSVGGGVAPAAGSLELSFEDAVPDLFPVVRGRGFFAGEPGRELGHWPFRTLTDRVAVGLLYDLPECAVHLQRQDLAAWGVTFDEARLRVRSREPFRRIGPGVVARYRILLDAGRPQSLWECAEGDDVLLPRTDTVVFLWDGSAVGMASWERVQKVVGMASWGWTSGSRSRRIRASCSRARGAS